MCDANSSLGCKAFEQVQASHERSGLTTHQSACWGQKQCATCAEMQLKSKPRVTSVGMAPGDQSGLKNLMEGPQLKNHTRQEQSTLPEAPLDTERT